MTQSKRKQYIKSLEDKKYSVDDAMKFIQASPKEKFNESIDVAVNLGFDPTQSDQHVRGATTLPAGSGKPCKVAVFVEGDLAVAAKEAGADAVGMEDLAEEIKKGDVDYDVVIATPDTMKIVSPLGKVLGPKGTMPNPKTGTVTKDVASAVKNAKAGQIRYRTDKGAIIQGRFGDITYSAEQIQQNLETLLEDLKRNKPASAKGVYIKKATLSSTMGAGVEVDLSSLTY